eukprot:TRINITY_DN28960_c0_g1_i1.p1 TRINITY_DN28960_c0_g1~~TRINITY_DN28960_c0_g1_i1.p1  ORF type:complete len:253 (+),score=75.02 TRINITY_DN28960_c0_g1_i1:48-806(+)
MGVSRNESSPAANLFDVGSVKDWNKEISERSGWSAKLKTVEAAKDKQEGLKARAKGKRGGDGSKGNYSTFGFEAEPEPQSTQRKPYPYKPEDRNPLMAGQMAPEEFRPGVKKVNPPKEKKQPKTHKVVNTRARDGTLRSETPGSAFAILAGAGEPTKTETEIKGKKCFGNFNAETTPPPQRPSGKGGRRHYEATDPWRYEKEDVNEPSALQKFPQRFNCTPADARKMHTFEMAPKGPRYPNYKLNPPYSIEA